MKIKNINLDVLNREQFYRFIIIILNYYCLQFDEDIKIVEN